MGLHWASHQSTFLGFSFLSSTKIGIFRSMTNCQGLVPVLGLQVIMRLKRLPDCSIKHCTTIPWKLVSMAIQSVSNVNTFSRQYRWIRLRMHIVHIIDMLNTFFQKDRRKKRFAFSVRWNVFDYKGQFFSFFSLSLSFCSFEGSQFWHNKKEKKKLLCTHAHVLSSSVFRSFASVYVFQLRWQGKWKMIVHGPTSKSWRTFFFPDIFPLCCFHLRFTSRLLFLLLLLD